MVVVGASGGLSHTPEVATDRTRADTNSSGSSKQRDLLHFLNALRARFPKTPHPILRSFDPQQLDYYEGQEQLSLQRFASFSETVTKLLGPGSERNCHENLVAGL